LNKTEDIVTKALDLSEQKSQADRRRLILELDKAGGVTRCFVDGDGRTYVKWVPLKLWEELKKEARQ